MRDGCQVGRGAPSRLVLGRGKPQGAGVAPGGALPDRVRADGDPQVLDGAAHLLGLPAAGRHARQDGDGGRVAGQLEDPSCALDGLEVDDLRAAGDDDEAGGPGGLDRGALRSRRRVDDGLELPERAPEPRHRDVDYRRGLFFSASALPAGRALRVDVDEDRFEGDGERGREAGLSRPALGRQEGDRGHDAVVVLSLKDWEALHGS